MSSEPCEGQGYKVHDPLVSDDNRGIPKQLP